MKRLLILCLFLSASAAAQNPMPTERCLIQQCVIKDGVGVENIIVGRSTLPDALARFGKDYELIDHNKYSFEARYEEIGISFYYRQDDAQKRIFAIDLRPPFKGITENGIVLGRSTFAEVENKYWPNRFSSTDDETLGFDYPGIQFHIKSDAALKRSPFRNGYYLRKQVVAITIDVIDPPESPVVSRSNDVDVSDGPLLFYYARTDTSKNAIVSHYVVDPEKSGSSRLFLTSSDDYKPWHRFNQNEFLMGSDLIPSDLLYLNIKTGASRPLLEGGSVELYKVDGSNIYFIEQEHSDKGFAPNAEKIVAPRPRSRDTRHRLYVFNPTQLSHSKLVTREPLLHVLAIDENYCWVVVDRAIPELWRIRKDGSEEKRIAVIKDSWLFGLKDAMASPDGGLLAFAVNDTSRAKRRTLFILNVQTGRVVYSSSGINVMESGERTMSPELKLVWLDNERVRFSETAGSGADLFFRWVDLNIKTGKRRNQKRYSEIAYEHVMPSRDSLDYVAPKTPWEQGLFIQGVPHRLYFKGVTEPVGDLTVDQFNTEIRVSNEGEWAVFAGPKTGAYLANGLEKSKKKLDKPGLGFTWMPAIRPSR